MTIRRSRGDAALVLALAVSMLAVSAIVGCAQVSEPPAEPIVPGTFRLLIDDNGSWGTGAYVQLEADGAISGTRTQGSWECAGRATVAEIATIAGVLSRLGTLGDDGSYIRGGCIDGPDYAITLEVLSGPDTGRTSHVRFVWCGEPSAYTALVDAALAPLTRLDAEGACDRCPTLGRARGCYEATEGDDRICDGATWRTCDTANADEVVGCTSSELGSLECDPSLGWVSAIRWVPLRATLRRVSEMGEVRFALYFFLDVDNRGASTSFPYAMQYGELRSSIGTVLWVPDTRPYAGPVLIPHTRDTYVVPVGSTVALDDSILTDTSLTFRLRTRPFIGAPYGAPIPVTVELSP